MLCKKPMKILNKMGVDWVAPVLGFEIPPQDCQESGGFESPKKGQEFPCNFAEEMASWCWKTWFHPRNNWPWKQQPFNILSNFGMIFWVVATQTFLEFSPLLPGEMIQFDEHIFHMGWFNHQLVFQRGKSAVKNDAGSAEFIF